MGNLVFGLPGNPVSAFVTFHLFVLPSLRKYCGFDESQWSLAKIPVHVIDIYNLRLFFLRRLRFLRIFQLLNSSLELDPRPEYARARIVSKNGKLYAEVADNQVGIRVWLVIAGTYIIYYQLVSQMSSRLASIAGADALLHLPAATADNKVVKAGTLLMASILKQHFISHYE